MIADLAFAHDTRIIIAIDLDYFYAQCEEVRNQSIKGKPVVICVFSGRTAESGAVSTANYVARGLGVKSGIPIALAKKILQENPESVFLPKDFEYYVEVSDRIMGLIRLHGDKFEQASVDEAYLDVTNPALADYHRAEAIGREIKTEIFAKEGLTCSIGIAPNKLMAKMAVDSKKPDGFAMILPEQVRPFLNPLPVGKLFGIGPKTEEKMKDMGIITVGELASANVQLLSEQFGNKLGLTLSRQANGIDEDPVVEKEPEQMSRIVTLKHDAEAFDFPEVLKPLADDLSRRLAASSYLSKAIGIILISSELKIKSRTRTLESPTNSEREILKIASEMFESYFNEEKFDDDSSHIRRVGIKVSNFTKGSDTKLGTLFDYI
jgi:DNA polymerase IV (archaeal DinB-like DNA polymerase)